MNSLVPVNCPRADRPDTSEEKKYEDQPAGGTYAAGQTCEICHSGANIVVLECNHHFCFACVLGHIRASLPRARASFCMRCRRASILLSQIASFEAGRQAAVQQGRPDTSSRFGSYRSQASTSAAADSSASSTDSKQSMSEPLSNPAMDSSTADAYSTVHAAEGMAQGEDLPNLPGNSSAPFVVPPGRGGPFPVGGPGVPVNWEARVCVLGRFIGYPFPRLAFFGFHVEEHNYLDYPVEGGIYVRGRVTFVALPECVVEPLLAFWAYREHTEKEYAVSVEHCKSIMRDFAVHPKLYRHIVWMAPAVAYHLSSFDGFHRVTRVVHDDYYGGGFFGRLLRAIFGGIRWVAGWVRRSWRAFLSALDIRDIPIWAHLLFQVTLVGLAVFFAWQANILDFEAMYRPGGVQHETFLSSCYQQFFGAHGGETPEMREAFGQFVENINRPSPETDRIFRDFAAASWRHVMTHPSTVRLVGLQYRTLIFGFFRGVAITYRNLAVALRYPLLVLYLLRVLFRL